MMMKIHRYTTRVTAILLCLCAIITFAMNMSCKKADEATASRWVTSTDGLKLRATPDMTGNVIAVIPYRSEVQFVAEKGDPLTIAGATGRWTELIWEGKKGFTFGGFLTATRPEVPSPGSDADLIEFAKNQYVNLYRREFTWNISDLNTAAMNRVREQFVRDTKVKKRMGNFVVLSHKGITDGSSGFDQKDSLWAWNGSRWNLYEDNGWMSWQCELLYLNGDAFVDAVCTCSHDITSMITWLGINDNEMRHQKSLNMEIGRTWDRSIDDQKWFTLGKCGQTKIYITESSEEKIITFDCAKNQFVKVPRQETPRAE